MQMRSNI